MTSQLSHIIVERSPGLVCAVAVARDGRPWHIFHQFWGGEREAVRAGQIVEARVKARDEMGGVFLEHISWKRWEGGFEPLYCDRKTAQGLTEGQALAVRVVSAARQDHVARVIPIEGDRPFSEPEDALKDWIELLGIEQVSEAQSKADTIDAVFDEVRTGSVGLSEGGMIHIERTRGMTVIDVDSAGRRGRGSAAARALSLNKQAVSETARQICLGGLGGVFAIDCVEPLTDVARTQLRNILVETFKDHDPRKLMAQKPSRFGILEAATAWRSTPVSEALETAEMSLALALRRAHKEMSIETGGFYTLELGRAAYDAYLAYKAVVDAQIAAYFHGRLSLAKLSSGQEGLKRQP
ncbi:MAG: ribonuclease E/G [Pseudomonadota bacterium]